MRRFLAQAITQRPLLSGATFITIFVLKLSLLAPPLLLGSIIDNLSLDNSAKNLTIPYLLCGYALIILVTAAVAPIQTYVLTRLVQQTVKDRSISWMAEIFQKEFCVFDNLRIGHLIKATDRGITAHEQILNFFITVGLPLIIEILVVSILFVHFGGAQLFAVLLTASCIYLYVCHSIIQWRTRHINDVNDSVGLTWAGAHATSHQSCTSSPSTKRNALSLVTSVIPSERLWAAIRPSNVPRHCPRRSPTARLEP